MGEPKENKQLLINYVVLQARLGIREFFLKTAVKEVYENIGQVLSLVRMQLAFVEGKTKEHKTEDIVQSGDLVGQSIRDLRNMCRSFYPDDDLVKDGGFIEGLENTLKILELTSKNTIKVKGVQNNTIPELKLVTFKILLDILNDMKERGWTYKRITVSYEEKATEFTIEYKGEVINLTSGNTNNIGDIKLSLKETAHLINGNIYGKMVKTGITSIILKIPLTILL